MSNEKLCFDNLNPQGSGFQQPVTILGEEWFCCWFDNKNLRYIARGNEIGRFAIKEAADGKYLLNIVYLSGFERVSIEFSQWFETLEDAIQFSGTFHWEKHECGGREWIKLGDGLYPRWVTVFGHGDLGVILGRGGDYSMKRELCPRFGESYEISCTRYKSGENDMAVRTFNEAAAIVMTMPTYLSALASQQ